MSAALLVGPDDPRAADVRALLEHHLDLARAASPPGLSFALDLDGLLDPGVRFVSAREDGLLLGVGALKRLDAGHAEVKSMHTAAAARAGASAPRSWTT